MHRKGSFGQIDTLPRKLPHCLTCTDEGRRRGAGRATKAAEISGADEDHEDANLLVTEDARLALDQVKSRCRLR
jgi:hypothetical protein